METMSCQIIMYFPFSECKLETFGLTCHLLALFCVVEYTVPVINGSRVDIIAKVWYFMSSWWRHFEKCASPCLHLPLLSCNSNSFVAVYVHRPVKLLQVTCCIIYTFIHPAITLPTLYLRDGVVVCWCLSLAQIALRQGIHTGPVQSN